MASGVGLDSAFGADAVNQIRAAVMQRLLQQQQLTQGAQGMDLAQRASDRADRALTQQDELRKATLAQNADLKDQGALDTLITQGAFKPGQELSTGTASRFQKHGLGDLVQPQQSLPSTQMQGGAAMPQLRGRMIPQSGAVGPEQGEASSGTMTSTQTTPMLTGRLMFRGTQKEADTTAERERKIAADQAKAAGERDRAENANWRAGIQNDLANFKMSQPPKEGPTVVIQTVDENGKPVTKIVPKTAGTTFAKAPGATVENRLASAQAVSQTGNDIVARLSDPAYAAKVGPEMGRFNTLRDFIGNPPPEYAELAGAIESYALANMGVHGMRSAQGAQQIAKLLDQHHTPESLIATIRGLSGFSQHFMQNEGRGSAAAGAGKKQIRYDENGHPIP